MLHLEKTIDGYVEGGILQHVAVRVGRGDTVLYDTYRGGVDDTTLFDMASVTKIMATTTLALIALDRGLLRLHDPVARFYPTDKPLTIEHLLTHTVGFGHKPLNQAGNTYASIAETILQIPADIPIGTDVLYSCPGFILLGKILESLFGMPLNECFAAHVAKPLGLDSTSFLPANRQHAVNANLGEEKRGVVNDYNCQFLGGVAGNAGLFSNLADITRYVRFLQRKGAPLIGEQTFWAAAENRTAGMSESRGLGFLYVDARYAQTGGLFPEGAIGHCGHTGQSVFVDPCAGLYVIILSDATIATVKKFGAEHYDEVVGMRAQLHAAIKQDIETYQ